MVHYCFTGLMNKIIVVLCLIAVVAFAKRDGASCERSIKMKYGETYHGNTINATNSSITCDTYKYSPNGMWYRLVGEGTDVVVETCDQRTNFDTVIFVMDSCQQEGGYNDRCVAYNDDGCNKRQSRVTFHAKNGY